MGVCCVCEKQRARIQPGHPSELPAAGEGVQARRQGVSASARRERAVDSGLGESVVSESSNDSRQQRRGDRCGV